MRRPDATGANRLVGYAVGGIAPVAIAAALVPLRGEVDNTNLALILMLSVTTAAILWGRGPGALAAVTSTLAFDFFLTRPYLSANIDDSDDLETALILLVVALLVGEVAARGRWSRRQHDQIAEAVTRVHRVADQIAYDAGLDDVSTSVKSELTALLGLHDCWVELAPFTWPLPRLERGGTLEASEHHWLGTGFSIPQDGVELPVIVKGDEVARVVLIGDPEVAVTLEERVVAVALADQLSSAVALAGIDELHRVVGTDGPRTD